MKKFFPIFLAIIFILSGTAAAKSKKEVKEIPPAIEFNDETRFQELGTDLLLREEVLKRLDEKKIFVVVDTGEETSGETSENKEESLAAVEKDSELKNSAKKFSDVKKSVDVFGDSLVFDTTEISHKVDLNAGLDQDFYKKFGVQYVVKCSIIALGTGKKIGDSVGIGIETGSHRSVGIGFGVFDALRTSRTVFGTAVNLNFSEVESNVVLWQRNLVGQAVKHRKPHKGYESAADEAYQKSVADAAEIIVEHLTGYAEKRILKKKDSTSTGGNAKK